MKDIIIDVRYAWVSMRRSRGFAVAALITLALGIGATTAVFSVVYGVLLRPLPYPESERLVRLYEEHPGAPRPPGEPPLSNTTMYAWRERTQTLEGLAAYYAREYTVTVAGQSTRIHGAEVSASAFSLLRAAPRAGRFFTAADETPKPRRVVVVSERFRRERLTDRSDVIGGAVTIEGQPYEIIGIAEQAFHFPDHDVEIWTPYEDPTLTDPSVQGGMWLGPTLARLKPDATIAQAEAEGTAVARSIPRPAVANLLFGAGGPVRVRVETLAGQMTGGARPILLLLAAGVVLVLFVACANVANLFLSRGVARQRELAVRAAIGAGRRRLTQQLVTESFIFSAAGGVLGLALAGILLRIAPLLAPADFPRLDAIRLDAIVVAIAVISSIVTALLSGVAPALRGARFDLAASLHGGDGATAGGFRSARAHRVRDALVVMECALAAVLLIGAALIGRSFARLTSVDAGYDPRNVLVARVYRPAGMSVDQARQFVETLLDRIRADGRVVAAGAGNMMPFADSTWITGFTLPDSIGRGKPTNVRAVLYVVTTGYMEALRLRVREGRALTSADARDGSLHVLVDREFVRQYLSEGPAAGRTFPGGPAQASTTEIVGVVDDVLKDGNDTRPQPEMYVLEQPGHVIQDEIDLVVRTRTDPAAVATLVRDTVRSIDAGAAVGDMMPLVHRVSASVAQPRFAAAVTWLFAGLAAVLASAGLYSVLSFVVVQRRREIGIRAALGAARWDLVRMVARRGLVLTIGGVAAGNAAAVALTRLMSRLLFGVSALDAASYAAAAVLLLAVASIACVIPAARAAAVEPAAVLRE
jgi:putative ABC transport system permease protein